MSQPTTLLALPRELRDEILSYLTLPDVVYTSSDKPNTENLHRSKIDANTYVDTRIYLPCRISPNVLGVCRQLRAECLHHHTYTLNTQLNSISAAPATEEPHERPTSNLVAARLGNETDEEAERLNDRGIRITLEAQRSQRGKFGYFIPAREELSPRFIALLPLMKSAKNLRLVIWPGFDWWNGSRPRAMRIVDGRQVFGDSAAAEKTDAVSYAVGKVLEHLPAVEELEIDVLAYVGDVSRWDLPDSMWEYVQYWLDGAVARELPEKLKSVKRRLMSVWNAKSIEAFYVQEETRLEGGKWRVKRRGDTRTVSAKRRGCLESDCANFKSLRCWRLRIQESLLGSMWLWMRSLSGRTNLFSCERQHRIGYYPCFHSRRFGGITQS
jgi:hypothetical protein